MGDITAILQGRRRKREEDDDEDDDEREKSRYDRSSRSKRDDEKDKRRHRDIPRDESCSDNERRHRKDKRRKLERSRSWSPSSEKNKRYRHRSPLDKERSRSPEKRHRHRHRSSNDKERSKSPEEKNKRYRHQSSLDKQERLQKRGREKSQDSDPLEEFIGPQPISRPRGRGGIKGSSGMDDRFADGYDPKTDLQLQNDSLGDDDWDVSLEAIRDRQRWKQQGAERLRSAGFTEEQIKKWEDSGREKDERDVRWTKKGEDREWDRGKKTIALEDLLKGVSHRK